jgi:ectoine hydroxylase-related dioxygenase (phytanoyl-CoA dioxygenase family)
MAAIDTWAGAITEQQRMYFEAYGYLVLRDLCADEIDEISDAFDAVYADPENPRLELRIVGHRWEPWTVMAPFIGRHPRLAALVDDERFLGVARSLIGPDATFEDSDGSIYACETEWHFDSPIENVDERHLKFAFYLEPTDTDSGAVRVLPSSHHDAELYEGPLGPYLGYDGAIEERTGVLGEHLPSWTLATKPGDVLLWDFRLMHATYGTTVPRRQFAMNYRSGVPGDV